MLELGWICAKFNAAATSSADLSVVVCDEHTHLPDKIDKELLEMRKDLKRKIPAESDPVYIAWSKYYRSLIILGYLFHFGQRLFRRFIDRRLKTTYNDNEELRNSFRSLAALSLVPLNHM
ncbi:unnamed protein product [Rotaria magnacalcarata]|uniref:Uncharacterized protein n=1 Tax=Rotaria magnacalcarata TaxID=392030 RepID=A0A816NZV5_9BILA|nr:unnamed protein product [Rotaria magnacalcarata]